QACFFLRFLVQWIASERAGQSVIPNLFWYLSLAGAATVLVSGIVLVQPVLIIANLPALVVYLRNLYLIYKRRQRTIVDPEHQATAGAAKP
ncbi:MAG: lipid-A-disaccharide synthase N-terminal domain-containing protein, partial [Alphaproteobacteria bacterium]